MQDCFDRTELNLIFVVGPPRSGTTLLASMLAGGEAYPMLPECTIVTQVIRQFNDILKFSEKQRYNAFVGDVDNLARIFRVPVCQLINSAIHRLHVTPKKYLVLKDPYLTLYLDVLASLFGEEISFKCVGIIREPHYVIASYRRVIQKQGKKISIEELTREIFNYYFILHNNVNENLHVVKYEDLVAYDESTIYGLQKFLGHLSVKPKPYAEVAYPISDTHDPFFSKNYLAQKLQNTTSDYYDVLTQGEVEYISNIFSGIMCIYGYS